VHHLVLVSSRATSTTSTLKLTSLATNIWLSLGSWNTSSSKVLHSLTAISWSTHEDSVGSSWCNQSKLIKGHDLSSSLEDSGTSSLGHTESANSELWHLSDTDIISHSSYEHSNLVFLSGHELNQLGQGQWWVVDLGHKQTLQHNLVELALCTALQETIELDQELQVWVVTLWCNPLGLFITSSSNKIDSLRST
jgi:hypothetical protein